MPQRALGGQARRAGHRHRRGTSSAFPAATSPCTAAGPDGPRTGASGIPTQEPAPGPEDPQGRQRGPAENGQGPSSAEDTGSRQTDTPPPRFSTTSWRGFPGRPRARTLCLHCRGGGPISLGELRSHEPHSVVKIHLKYALQAYPAAHPPTSQTWAEPYSVRYRLRKSRHSSAKGGPPAEAAPPAGTAPDLTASQPGPPLRPQNLSQQNCSPPPILEDQQLHGVHVTPGGHRTPPVPAARGTQGLGKGTSHTGRSPHRTWPGAWDCRHSSNGHRAQEAAGGQSRPAVSSLAPGCPGFSSAPPKRPPLSPGGSREVCLLLPRASEGAQFT